MSRLDQLSEAFKSATIDIKAFCIANDGKKL